MVAITKSEPDQGVTTSIEIVKDNGKITPVAVGMIAAEVAIDAAIAYGVYRLLKLFKR